MRNLITAIARLLGLSTRSDKVTAEPTQNVGPVNQEPTPQAGKVSSVETTNPQSLPAPTVSKQKQGRARSTTQAVKPGKKKSTAQTGRTANQSKATGSKSATPVSKTRQPAKQAAKAKR